MGTHGSMMIYDDLCLSSKNSSNAWELKRPKVGWSDVLWLVPDGLDEDRDAISRGGESVKMVLIPI